MEWDLWRACGERHVSYAADTPDLANRIYRAWRAARSLPEDVGAEFIIHGREPRLQDANLIVNDPKFPGLEGVTRR